MPDAFASPPALTPAPPALPPKWQAVVLLTPYRNGQIYAAEVLYDWTANTMRVTAWGLEGAALDILYTGDQYFVLVPPGEHNQKALGPFPSTVAVPPPDWLHPRGMFKVGSGDVMGADCDWWVGYSANTNGYENPPPGSPALVCNWVWARRDTGYPFRMFFNNADNPYGLPGLGDFSLSIFTAFEAVPETDLARLADGARSQADPVAGPHGDQIRLARSFDDLYAEVQSFTLAGSGENPALRAGKLIKGLAPAPPDAPLPEWSPRLCITGFTYPTAKTLNVPAVLPIRVFYDWPKGRMLTRCSLAAYGFDGVPVQDLILDTSTTHIVIKNPDGTHVCGPIIPVGLPKPDWAHQDGGVPKAILRDNPVLGPGETIHITTLPSQGNRWFWVWYTTNNDGRLFMETPQFGDVGLVLTDYQSFDHNPPAFPDSAFEVPPDCVSPHLK